MEDDSAILKAAAQPLYARSCLVMRQGAGLANVGTAAPTNSCILVGADATAPYAGGKVMIALKNGPVRTGTYPFFVPINSLAGKPQVYPLDTTLPVRWMGRICNRMAP